MSAEKKIPEAKEPRGKTQKGRQKGERPGDTTGDDGAEVFLEQERTSARGGLSGASARRRYRSPAEGNEYSVPKKPQIGRDGATEILSVRAVPTQGGM